MVWGMLRAYRRMKTMKKGKLFVITAPSGAGKTSLVRQVINQIGHECHLHKVITYTTKSPRPGEVPGKDYNFLSEQEFKERINQGFFVEHSTAYGSYYGFPKEVFSFLATGKSYMGIVDIAGAESIKAYTAEAVLVGIRPPDISVLQERLTSRAEDTDKAIQFRLSLAQDELDKINQEFFNHVIINDVFEQAVKRLEAIVRQELA